MAPTIPFCNPAEAVATQAVALTMPAPLSPILRGLGVDSLATLASLPPMAPLTVVAPTPASPSTHTPQSPAPLPAVPRALPGWIAPTTSPPAGSLVDVDLDDIRKWFKAVPRWQAPRAAKLQEANVGHLEWTSTLRVMVADLARRWEALPPEEQDQRAAGVHQHDTQQRPLWGCTDGYIKALHRMRAGMHAARATSLSGERAHDGTFLAQPDPATVQACHAVYLAWRRWLPEADKITLSPFLDAAARDDARAATAKAVHSPYALPPLAPCNHCGALIWPGEAARCCSNGSYVIKADQFPREVPPELAHIYADDDFHRNIRFINMRLAAATRCPSPGTRLATCTATSTTLRRESPVVLLPASQSKSDKSSCSTWTPCDGGYGTTTSWAACCA
jgi:hypothetical protein